MRCSSLLITRTLKLGATFLRQLDVTRRVHRQEHVAHRRQGVRVEVLEHHAALGRREEHRVPGDVDDVGVAQTAQYEVPSGIAWR